MLYNLWLNIKSEGKRVVAGFFQIRQGKINFVEMLSDALPEGWKIYVKDHPVQFYNNGISYSAFRFRWYYERISKIKGVEIVPMDTSTYTLMDHAQATATITGTAAWESLMRLKPALIFGDNWFQKCPGLFRINNVKECREAFNFIKSGNFKISQEEIVRFLFAFETVTMRGNFYFFAKRESNVDEETNVNNFYGYIAKALM